MALDHSRINLPPTYRANDAHPKRCPLEEINSSLSFYLFAPSFLCWLTGLISCSHLMFLLLNSLSFSTPTIIQLSVYLLSYFVITTYLPTVLCSLYNQVLQSPRTPRQKTPLIQRWESGLVNGHNTEDDWWGADGTNWREGRRFTETCSFLKWRAERLRDERGKRRLEKGAVMKRRKERECEVRKRSGI